MANPTEDPGKANDSSAMSFVLLIKGNSHQTGKGRMLENKWKPKTDTQSIRSLGLVGDLSGPGRRAYPRRPRGLPRRWMPLVIPEKYGE